MAWKVFNMTDTEQILSPITGQKSGKNITKEIRLVRKDIVFRNDANNFTVISDDEKTALEKDLVFKSLQDDGKLSVVKIDGGKKGEESEKKKATHEKVKTF
jgi:hypothetical protein